MLFRKHMKNRFGYTLEENIIELVTIRVWVYQDREALTLPEIASGTFAEPIKFVQIADINDQVPVYDRNSLVKDQQLSGPCIVIDDSGTLYIDIKWAGKVCVHGHIHLQMTTDHPECK